VPPFSFFVKNVEQGAVTQVFAAISPEHVEGGVYFDTCQLFYGPQQDWAKTHDPQTMEQIWGLSEEAIQGLGFSLEALQDHCCVAMGPTQRKLFVLAATPASPTLTLHLLCSACRSKESD
jgi:hypothetical protein